MGNCLKATNDEDSQYSTNEELHSSNYNKCKNSLICNTTNDIISSCGQHDSAINLHTIEQQAGDIANENEPQKIGDIISSDENHRNHHNLINYNNKLNHIKKENDEYTSTMKADGDVYHDCETSSSFAETWDPILFDHIPTSQQNVKQIESKHQLDKNNREKYQINNGLDMYKQNRWPLISTSILGFTVLRSDIPDSVEWLRNGEIENSKINNLNKYLIKGKCNHRKLENGNENNTNVDELDDDIVLKSGFTSIHDNWLRYTMFIHQEKSDSIQFLSTYRRMKHIFLSLEVRTGCEIRMSRRLFLHKGKLVRTIVIDGPTRQQILRCYSSLPELLTRLMILECERPSEVELKTLNKIKKNERGFKMFTSLFQKPILTA